MTLGWAIAYCCNKLDQGIDPRNIEVPEIREALDKDIPNEAFEPTISVAELREWCEHKKRNARHRELLDTEEAFNEAIDLVIQEFCKNKEAS